MTSAASAIKSYTFRLFPSGPRIQTPESTKVGAVAFSLLQEAGKHDNGESTFTTFIEKLFLLINGVGFGRQILGVFENSVLIRVCRKVHSVSSRVLNCTAVTNALSSIGEIFCGFGNTLAAAKDTLPAAWRKLERVTNLDTVLQNLLSKGNELEISLVKAGKEMSEQASIAIAVFFNHFLYLFMGISQMLHGVVTSLYPTAVAVQYVARKAFAHLSALSGPLVQAIAKVSACVTAGIYFCRGLLIGYRAFKSYNTVKDFENRFAQAGRGDTTEDQIESMMNFMRKEEDTADHLEEIEKDFLAGQIGKEEHVGTNYLKRRFSQEYCVRVENGEKVVYTAKGKVHEDGSIEAYDKIGKITYLQAVHKGIHSEKVKQYLGAIIAVSMMVGAVLTIVATCICTGGIGLGIVGLSAAIFFTFMEGAFYAYDSPSGFAKFRDSRLFRYVEPKGFDALERYRQELIKDNEDYLDHQIEDVAILNGEEPYIDASEQDVDTQMPEFAEDVAIAKEGAQKAKMEALIA